MKKTILLAALTSIGMCANTAHADDAQWSGSGLLGFSATSGNSDTESLNAGLALKRESGKWVNELGVDILRASTDDIDTAERYTINTKTGYKFDDNDYIYYGTRYDKDNFSGFDYTITTGLGWGHKFHDDEKHRFITELGVGYKTEAIDEDRTENNGAVLIGKLDYMRQLTDTIKFEDVLIVEAGDDNTFAQNDLGFSFAVSDAFAVKLLHQIRHNTDAPAGNRSTDTLVSANLVYDFFK